jgi:histidyl-tRNA synthetase
MTADAELVQLACELLSGLKVERFSVRVNNRKVLSGLMQKVGITSVAAEMGVLRTIDKLPKIGEEETSRLLREENGLASEQVAKVFEFLRFGGGPREVLAQVNGFFEEGSVGRQGSAELKAVVDIVDAVGLLDAVTIDLTIARGLTYYTGTIYEAFLGNLPGYGAVMGGGRYDGLIGVFKGEDIPGVGISLGIDRLLEGLVELKLLEEETTVAQVLVSVFHPDLAPTSAKIARMLRAAGVACELFPACVKMGKQLRHGERMGHRWVVVCGPDEQLKGAVAVKNMAEGKQEELPMSELAAYLKKRIQ